MIEFKMTLDTFASQRNKKTGMYIFRVISKVPMTSTIAKSSVINRFIGEVDAAVNEMGAHGQEDNYKNRLRNLENSQILLFKEKNLKWGDDDIYYYQLVLKVENADTNSTGIVYDLMRSIYTSWRSGDDKTYCPTDYGVQIIELDTDCEKLLRVSDISFQNFILDTVMLPENNIAISTEIDMGKKYNRGSLMKVRYSWYQSLRDAFINKTNNTYCINDYSYIFPPFFFGKQIGMGNGSLVFQQIYKSKPNLDFIDGIAVFWDGEKSKNCVLPYISKLKEANIKMLDIIQFSDVQDFFYSDMRTKRPARKFILHFMNRERIFTSKCSLALRREMEVEGGILCLPVKGKKKRRYNFSIRSRDGYAGELIIPVDEDDSQKEATRLGVEMLYKNIHGMPITSEFSDYKNLLFNFTANEEDILTEWFSYCTKSMRNTDDSIIRTYLTMKRNLEAEYKEIGAYLNCYDFSRCQPIPRIVSDKKLQENYYKSLQIEPQNIIIKSINKKKIKPISETQPIIKFMLREKKGCRIGEFPLSKCLNVKTNEIELYYNKMKGEINRAKTQNRR